MRQKMAFLIPALVLLAAVLSSAGISASSAQVSQDIPLTLQSFRNLTAQEGARLLLGPSAELVSKMIVGWPPPVGGRSLDLVRLYLRPTAVKAGLCMQNEVDVFLQPADGTLLSAADASSVMKIADINLVHEFAVVGDLSGTSNAEEKTGVETKCRELNPFAFFAAASSDEAWEAAYLAELALKRAASDGPGQTTLVCRLPGAACDSAYDLLTKLSVANIGSVHRDCGGATQGSLVCYSVGLRDGGAGWTINVEASRDPAVRTGQKFNIKSTSFGVVLQPVI